MVQSSRNAASCSEMNITASVRIAYDLPAYAVASEPVHPS